MPLLRLYNAHASTASANVYVGNKKRVEGLGYREISSYLRGNEGRYQITFEYERGAVIRHEAELLHGKRYTMVAYGMNHIHLELLEDEDRGMRVFNASDEDFHGQVGGQSFPRLNMGEASSYMSKNAEEVSIELASESRMWQMRQQLEKAAYTVYIIGDSSTNITLEIIPDELQHYIV